MLRYISSLTNVDSLFKDDQEVPSIKKYWERREATAGAFCVIATIPFAYGVDVDKSVYDNPVMYELWRHASSFVHISNDMFSFRKELMDDQYENLIPVLMLNYNINCNVAMQKGYDFLRIEAIGLRLSIEMLPSSSETLSPAVSNAFIRGCFDTAMDLAHWSYSGARYLKGCKRNNDNTISFTIHRQRQLEKETKTHYELVESKLPSNTGDSSVLDKMRSMAPKPQRAATS
ncbi:terpene cyclase [Penicillium ucsense]|uniref:Terpene synthase n=1 Tax=Penicillium ucsense TaxID=2839758 RepID=A0A8J8W7G2_9EURO|nr:terpene cyclase [Penicillium ucsense]KAF7738117.1 terpene cyclase [Penicillium ucsense]